MNNSRMATVATIYKIYHVDGRYYTYESTRQGMIDRGPLNSSELLDLIHLRSAERTPPPKPDVPPIDMSDFDLDFDL